MGGRKGGKGGREVREGGREREREEEGRKEGRKDKREERNSERRKIEKQMCACLLNIRVSSFSVRTSEDSHQASVSSHHKRESKRLGTMPHNWISQTGNHVVQSWSCTEEGSV